MIETGDKAAQKTATRMLRAREEYGPGPGTESTATLNLARCYLQIEAERDVLLGFLTAIAEAAGIDGYAAPETYAKRIRDLIGEKRR